MCDDQDQTVQRPFDHPVGDSHVVNFFAVVILTKVFTVIFTPGAVQICNIGCFKIFKFLNISLLSNQDVDPAMSLTHRRAPTDVLSCLDYGC
jgi:hypothetical protein